MMNINWENFTKPPKSLSFSQSPLHDFAKFASSLGAFVVKSSKFAEILTKNLTFVILATSFFKAQNTKLFKYSLLQININFLLVL